MDEINNETPVIFFGGEPQTARQKLGVVVGGSLSEGVLVKLDRDTLIEGLSVGSYVTIDGQTNRKFFGLITDIALDAT
ncbi:MAG: HAS-barrel domain-containing protein, partial [Anaerolineae bacterium]